MKLEDFEQRFGVTWGEIHQHANYTYCNDKGKFITSLWPLDYKVFRYHVVGQHSLEDTANEFGVHMSDVLDLIADLVVRVKERLER